MALRSSTTAATESDTNNTIMATTAAPMLQFDTLIGVASTAGLRVVEKELAASVISGAVNIELPDDTFSNFNKVVECLVDQGYTVSATNTMSGPVLSTVTIKVEW
jgi:hypothetical protein